MQTRPQIHPPHRRHRRHAGRPRVAAGARRPFRGRGPRRRRVRHLALVCDHARSLRVARPRRVGRGRTRGPHRRSRRDPRQHRGRQARPEQALAARADRPAGREGGGRHLRDLAPGARDRGAGARCAGARGGGAQGRGKRARRRGREDQAGLAAGDGIEESAAGQGPVVAVSRSRHWAGRRDLHQVPGHGIGRHRHVDRRARVIDLEQSRARGRGRRHVEEARSSARRSATT